MQISYYTNIETLFTDGGLHNVLGVASGGNSFSDQPSPPCPLPLTTLPTHPHYHTNESGLTKRTLNSKSNFDLLSATIQPSFC